MEVKVDLERLGKISLQNIILDLYCEIDFQEDNIGILNHEKELSSKQCVALLEENSKLKNRIDELEQELENLKEYLKGVRRSVLSM